MRVPLVASEESSRLHQGTGMVLKSAKHEEIRSLLSTFLTHEAASNITPTHSRPWHDLRLCLPSFYTQGFPGIKRWLGQQTFTEATLHWGHPAASCGIVGILHGYQRVIRRCYSSFLLFSACLFQLDSHTFLIFFSTCFPENTPSGETT